MTKRLISATIGILLVIMVVIFDDSMPFILNYILAAICGMAVFEIFSAMRIEKKYIMVVPSVIFSMIMPLFGMGMTWITAWYVFTVIMFSIMIFKLETFALKDILAVQSMVMLITMSLSMLIRLRDEYVVNGSFYVMLTLTIPWLTDSGAFFIGKMKGRRKLCPSISPNKTVEGAIGGVITSVIGGLLVAVLFKYFILEESVKMEYLNIIMLALSGGILAIIGDLCFSLIKRSCNVKDFGNTMPGHGGVLDRFDSVIFVAPYVYIYTMYVPVLS